MGAEENIMPVMRYKTIILANLVIIIAGFVLIRFGDGILFNRPRDGYIPREPYVRWLALHSFIENGVKVDIALERDGAGQAILAATYTPMQEHFHLYSKDLPRNGIDGAGRPTLLEIAAPGGVQPIGAVTADLPASDYTIDGFDRPFPVYPDGPVTMRLPIELPRASDQPATVRLTLTYMTCSSYGVCSPPVVEKPVSVIIPGTTASH